MGIHHGEAIDFLWLAFVVYWIVAARRVSKMRNREPAGERALYILLVVVAIVLLNSGAADFSALDRRFVPRSHWIADAGVLLTAAGIAFAIWARNHIGKFWSASVSIREGHELVRSGPYARIRHPIYTGILVGLAGTALAMGNVRGIATFAILLAALSFKARKEEALLAREFGAAFEDHRRRTGFFLTRFFVKNGEVA